MAKRQDIRQDELGDIYINPVTGDFGIVESDSQHISDILQAVNGDYKEFPLIGVNFYTFENSSNQQQNLERIIRIQAAADGYKVTNVIVPETVSSISDITVYANEPEI